MWALLVCVLVKPVEIANGLDLQHGTSAECLDVATDGKGGRPSTFVVEVKRTSSCPNCGGANHSGEGQNNVLCANGQQGLRNRVIWNSSHPYASQFQRGAPRNMPNSTFFTAAAANIGNASRNSTAAATSHPFHPAAQTLPVELHTDAGKCTSTFPAHCPGNTTVDDDVSASTALLFVEGCFNHNSNFTLLGPAPMFFHGVFAGDFSRKRQRCRWSFPGAPVAFDSVFDSVFDSIFDSVSDYVRAALAGASVIMGYFTLGIPFTVMPTLLAYFWLPVQALIELHLYSFCYIGADVWLPALVTLMAASAVSISIYAIYFTIFVFGVDIFYTFRSLLKWHGSHVDSMFMMSHDGDSQDYDARKFKF